MKEKLKVGTEKQLTVRILDIATFSENTFTARFLINGRQEKVSIARDKEDILEMFHLSEEEFNTLLIVK